MNFKQYIKKLWMTDGFNPFTIDARSYSYSIVGFFVFLIFVGFCLNQQKISTLYDVILYITMLIFIWIIAIVLQWRDRNSKSVSLASRIHPKLPFYFMIFWSIFVSFYFLGLLLF